MKSEYLNIAAYKFVDLDDLAARKSELLPFCKSLGLKGTILLSREGINLFLAGTGENIKSFLGFLRAMPEFCDLEVKQSLSDNQPFSRMLVRIKQEIISMGVETIRPLRKTSPKVSAKTLKQWLDDGKELTLLDVRNDYEIAVGTFTNAMSVGVDHFRKFPEATRALPMDLKSKPIVMFCTGGIRCEKAGPLMEQEGFHDVYQLEGGILKYFEECGGDHYEGDCFVFDKRVAVDPALNETEFEQCYACQSVLSLEEQESEFYDPPHSCPNCYRTESQRRQDRLDERNNLVAILTTPLPGSIPYDNIRPMNVPLRYDHRPAIEFLTGMHANLEEDYWRAECELGRITYKARPLSASELVRAGWRVEHHIPQTTEPVVNNAVKFLYEDDQIIALDKPAPLPMHACGRFNRNTLDYFVNLVFADDQIRILHRLDANTTGVVVMAKKKSAARFVAPQFLNGEVTKTYLARVIGHPIENDFQCNDAISVVAATAGSRTIEPSGQSALTKFHVLQRFGDGTALVHCHPQTGRTNQIRLHLSHLGFPICGDPTYNSVDSVKQSLAVGDPPMCLHAWKLELTHPTSKERIEFISSIPKWAE